MKTVRNRHAFSLGMILAFGIVSLALFLLLARQSDAARANFYQLQHELDLYRRGIWRLEKLDISQLERELRDMNSRFPPSEQLGVVIGELAELSKTCNISITSITPSEKVEAHEENNGVLSHLSRVPIEMRLRGKYDQIARFLSHLGALEHGVMKVDRFRLEKEETEDSAYVALDVAASVYVRKGLDQEILKREISQTDLLERKAGRSRFPKSGRNPFTKTVVQAEVKAPVKLEGIIFDPLGPMVLVNGETKGVGDVVNDLKIVEIDPDSVVFEGKGEKIKMRLRWD